MTEFKIGDVLLTAICDSVFMLQVWKIEVPTDKTDSRPLHGWALAHTAEEAKSLAGFKNAVIEQKPEHLWIARERVIWENRVAA